MLFAAIANLLLPLFPLTADVRDTYSVPLLSIPETQTPPVIDGVIEPAEWQGALEMNILQQLGSRELSAMQTRWFLMWDSENLYLAMRSPLRTGERLIQNMRHRDRDYNVVFDDSYEIFLDAGTRSPDGQPVFFQFLANFAGARFDVMFEPQVGNSRPGWRSGWEPVNRITPDGTAWEYELVIPRNSLFVEKPFQDGFEIRLLLARNFKRPWLQNSITGQNDFSSRDAFARAKLSSSAPALHVLALGDPEKNTFGLHLNAFSKKPQNIRWNFEANTGQKETGIMKLPAGELVKGPNNLAIAPAAGVANNAEFFRVTVSSEDAKTTWFDFAARLGFSARDNFAKTINDKGDQVNLSARLNPVKDYIRINGDFIQYDDRDKIAVVEAVVKNPAGKVLANTKFELDDLAYASGVMQLEKLEPGKITVEMIAKDADGATVLTRTTEIEKWNHKEKFTWWDTKWGKLDKVIPPFTAVKTDGNNKVSIWGRTIDLSKAGLPSQILTQNIPLLQTPVTLIAELQDGSRLSLEGAKIEKIASSDVEAKFRAQGKLGDLSVQTEILVGFDGVMKFTLDLDPAKPLELRSLQVVIPLANDKVNYVHGSGEGIRYGFDARFIPEKGEGRLWDSKIVDGQNMTVGSFIPYVYIGSTKGGLAWFADSDQGWVPNNNVPAIELRRDNPKSVDLVLNLVSEPFTMDAKRRVVFGLQATPVKPMPPDWRNERWGFDATFHDFAGITTQPGRQHSDLIWMSVPYVINKEYAVKKASDWKQSRGMAVPYFEQNTIGTFPPDPGSPGYFGEHWKAGVGNTLWFEKTLQDFIVHGLAEWVQIADIDGWYVDNVRPEACDNIEAGRGYKLPDGRIQPTYQIFEQRDYWLRVRAAFYEAGKIPPKIVLHMTHNVVIPWIGTADLALDHEANVIFPEMNKTFMDMWSLERLRLNVPDQWGTPFISMSKYDGDWSRASDEVKERNMRSFVGAVRLHDIIPQSHRDLGKKAFDSFGFGQPDVQYIGYWDPQLPVISQTEGVYASAWMRPADKDGTKRLLLIVTNWNQKPVTAKFQIKKDGILAKAKNIEVYDAEIRADTPDKDATLPLAANGTFSLDVGHHLFRLVRIDFKE